MSIEALTPSTKVRVLLDGGADTLDRGTVRVDRGADTIDQGADTVDRGAATCRVRWFRHRVAAGRASDADGWIR